MDFPQTPNYPGIAATFLNDFGGPVVLQGMIWKQCSKIEELIVLWKQSVKQAHRFDAIGAFKQSQADRSAVRKTAVLC